MNARIALVAGLVSLLALATGCARPDVVPVATSARVVPTNRLPAVGPGALESARPFEMASAPHRQPAILPTTTRDRAPTATVRAQPRPMMLVPATALDRTMVDHHR